MSNQPQTGADDASIAQRTAEDATAAANDGSTTTGTQQAADPTAETSQEQLRPDTAPAADEKDQESSTDDEPVAVSPSE